MSQDMTLAISNAREPESEEKPQKSLNEKQQVIGFLYARKNNLGNCVVSNIHTNLFLLICFSGSGEPGVADQVYITELGIFWGQADCCLCHIQMSSPLEVI